MGFVFGMDLFVSPAHGAVDARGAGLALQRGAILGLFVTTRSPLPRESAR